MKTITSPNKGPYVARVAIVLIMIALIGGMAGCGPSGKSHTLTISSTAGGSVTHPGEGTFTYTEGRVVVLAAYGDKHWHFVEWTGDVDTIADVSDHATTITMHDSYFITANFDIDAGWYSLTISSTVGGSVAYPREGTFTYTEGKVVDLVAEADEGYRFVNWTGDVDTIADVNAPSTAITMNDHYFITANFEEIPEYDLIMSSTDGGSVTTPGEGTSTYEEGTVIKLVATSDPGYRFVNWTGDVGTIFNVNARSTTITMNDHYSITANFEYAPNKIDSHTGEYENYHVGLLCTSEGRVVSNGCYDDTGNLTILIDNENAIDPSYSQLVSFLQWDDTDQFPYIYQLPPQRTYYGRLESYVNLERIKNIIDGSVEPGNPLICNDFAERLHNNAEMAGIRCGHVTVVLSGYTDPYDYGMPSETRHACNAFETTDRGLVYIDVTGLPANEPGSYRAVKTVSIVVGEPYTPVSLFEHPGFEYLSMGTVTDFWVVWDGTWNN